MSLIATKICKYFRYRLCDLLHNKSILQVQTIVTKMQQNKLWDLVEKLKFSLSPKKTQQKFYFGLIFSQSCAFLVHVIFADRQQFSFVQSSNFLPVVRVTNAG